MEYRKSPHNVDPVVVMSSIFRRPQTWAVLLLILFAPILAGSILASTQNQEMLNNTTATLRETSERQRDFAVSTLDSIALIMNENTSNIHYIDVGRTEAKDDEVDAALACQVLRQNTEPYPNINSAYLICNLNHTIYNSLDKIGYADDEFYDLSWRLQYHASRGGMQLLDDIRTVRTPYRQEDTYISMVSRVPYLSTLQNKWLVYNISINDLGNRLITEAEASRDANYSNTLWIYNSKGNLIWSQQDGDIPETYDELLSRQDTSVTVTDGVLISTKEGRYLTATTEDATYGWRYVQTLPYTNVLNKTHNTNRRLWAGMIIVIVILLFIWFNTIYTQNASERQAAENIRLKTNIPPKEAEDCLTYLARVSTQEQARAAANDQVLHSFRDVLQEHIVLSLISGEPVHGEKTTARRELMTKMGLLQDQPQKYTVMLARIGGHQCPKTEHAPGYLRPVPQNFAVRLQRTSAGRLPRLLHLGRPFAARGDFLHPGRVQRSPGSAGAGSDGRRHPETAYFVKRAARCYRLWQCDGCAVGPGRKLRPRQAADPAQGLL